MVFLKVLLVLVVSLYLVNCSVISKSKNKTETTAQHKIDNKTGIKSEGSTGIKTEAKAGIKTEARGGLKTEAKSGTKRESKTVTKTEAKTNITMPCTCGVFLTGQFVRGSGEQPKGDPVFIQEENKAYSCNAIGQKQCQAKCVETIVSHLPNSANLLCATLDRDCRKERAYLFIKNCKDTWINTNLAAGKEYCCKDGLSYPCPLI